VNLLSALPEYIKLKKRRPLTNVLVMVDFAYQLDWIKGHLDS
jgi:hypothetical protein